MAVTSSSATQDQAERNNKNTLGEHSVHGRQPLRWLPMISAPAGHTYVQSPLFNGAGSGDMFLTN